MTNGAFVVFVDNLAPIRRLVLVATKRNKRFVSLGKCQTHCSLYHIHIFATARHAELQGNGVVYVYESNKRANKIV